MRHLLHAIVEPQSIWGTWEEYADSDHGKRILKDICTPCRAMAQQIHETGRRTAWATLPGFFKLPPWEGLKDFED